ncbi:hypothetical protein [Nocardia sp. NPDC004604]|uniref:hypothetical protein n=1 Tax=Nocardia sp. NPDC004604 TaxID=3157013 RepID=UPI00339EF403
MASLRTLDEDAWFLLKILKSDAEEFGLDPRENREAPNGNRQGSYRCPVGRDIYQGVTAPPGALPWLGELEVEGTVPVDGHEVHWRYYFIEPRVHTDIEDDRLLGCSVRHKGIASAYNAADQTRHMRGAIEAGKRWCRQNRYTWRPSMWDSGY